MSTPSATVSARWAGVAATVGLVGLGLAAPGAAAGPLPAAVGSADQVAGNRISITVTGALPVTRAKVTIKGLTGKAKGCKRTVQVARRKTVRQLPSGQYRVTAATRTHNGASAKAEPRKWLVSVTARQGAAVAVTYARVPGAVERVATSSHDKQANGYSDNALWSPDGTRIAFTSTASNLAAGDDDNKTDLFVKNLRTGKTTLISTEDNNVNVLSRLFSPGAFSWVSNTRLAYFAYPRADRRYSGVVKDVRTGNRKSSAALPRRAIPFGGWSSVGTAFIYLDTAVQTPSNLFVKDLATGATTRVSATAAGTLGNGDSSLAEPVWSPDGTRVAFDSDATNLSSRSTAGHTNVYVKTLATRALQLVSTDAGGHPGDFDSEGQMWSPDGTRIAFIADPAVHQGIWSGDLVVKVLATGALRRLATLAGYPSWSPDGSKILFVHATGSLRVADLATGRVSRLLSRNHYLSEGDDFLGGKQWSPDGEQVLFSSGEPLVRGDTNGIGRRADGNDIFAVSVASGRVTRLSTTSKGRQAAASHSDAEGWEGGSWSGFWSPDGSQIAFTYWSYPKANLVPNDTNGYPDVFVKTLN